jgi:hypothetical protein
VPVQPAAIELLAALSGVLEHWGEWYVFGAQAVIAYGVPRLSADVDVTLRIRATLRLLEEALAQSDLLPRFDAIRGEHA